MSLLASHLIVVPVVLPLLTAAVLLLIREQRRRLQALLNIGATAVGLAVAVALLLRVHGVGAVGSIGVYLAANWQAPFGIVLVADRLSALMLVLVSAVGLCTALYAEAGWARAGVYFHPLFQIQLMGLCGAFLTGDLFNLFVFFEVALAASYGLQLHGSGWPRVRSGLHYIAVNLLASALFLVGLAVLYGVMGTLSMADVAAKLPLVPATDRGILHAGVAILAVAFLIKAAVWPLNAWLLPAYTATSPPVAALFALMTKLGIYALLRLWTLLFSADTGPSAHFGSTALLVGGLVTMALGVLGLIASFRLGRIAAFSILTSAGTLLASLGFGNATLTSAALYYMLNATLAASTLFLLVELIERIGSAGLPPLRDVDFAPGEDTNLDDEQMPLVGRAVPVSLALLGLAFLACTLLVAGLPPLSGFLAKLSLLTAAIGSPAGEGASGATVTTPARWVFFALLLVSGLAATVSLIRAGIRHFWSMGGRAAPQVKGLEAISIVTLLLVGLALTVGAEPVTRYTRAAAAELHAPRSYIEAVSSTRPRPGPTQRTAGQEGPP